MLSRRDFLRASSILSISPVVPGIFASTARAAGTAGDARVLVVIQLDGGNDGINTVVPFGDDGYGQARQKLRLDARKLHKLNGHVGLHPSMRAFKQLYDDGQLAIVQGVGYPNPDRSHFRSMRIWQTARFDDTEHDGNGWLGRALDQPTMQGVFRTNSEAIFVGDQETPVALWGRRSSAMALARLEDLQFEVRRTDALPVQEPTSETNRLRQFVTKQVLTAYSDANEFQRRAHAGAGARDSIYPATTLGSRLKLVSTLLQQGSQARIYYVIQGGYDTHAGQLYLHAGLLNDFAESVKAFFDDLQSAGLADRVALLAFSEFGRRVHENASAGTDHGTAGPVFLVGGTVSPGLMGSTPNLSDVDDGDLRMQIDFRSVYAAILDQWFGVDSTTILGESVAAIQAFS